MKKKIWVGIKAIAFSAVMAVFLSINGCSAAPNLIDSLQTQAQLRDTATPTHLTDYGILMYGENVLAAWGLRSQRADVFNTGTQIALAALSTGALATAGSANVPPNATKGIVSAFNFLLQLLGIIKPAERNDARQEGAAMILEARGNFLETLALECVDRLSNTKFTRAGALYFKQIGSAIKVVDKLIVGLPPHIEDLEQLKPVAARTPRGSCDTMPHKATVK